MDFDTLNGIFICTIAYLIRMLTKVSKMNGCKAYAQLVWLTVELYVLQTFNLLSPSVYFAVQFNEDYQCSGFVQFAKGARDFFRCFTVPTLFLCFVVGVWAFADLSRW